LIDQRGPDLVLAGAARSGTTLLAGRLGRHHKIVSPAIKEPNYFSSRLDRGYDWYAGLYESSDGLWLDASAQYTFPSHLDALGRAAELAPQLRIVYLVRDPVPRAYSHYCHEVLYLGKHNMANFGGALHVSGDLAGASDYALILAALADVVPRERLLVLPFEFVVDDLNAAANLVWQFAGLDPADAAHSADDTDNELFANESAIIANPIVRRVFNRLRGTRLYPRIRTALGAERVRAARARLTTSESIPPLHEALTSCTPADLDMLAQLQARSATAVRDFLTEQDARLGTDLRRTCAWIETSQ
jgi:hypothetical protein